MKPDEQKLYDEWKRVEDAVTPEAQISSIKGHYRTKPINAQYLYLAVKLRERVWNELRDKLSVEERSRLGKRLGKSNKDIFPQSDF